MPAWLGWATNDEIDELERLYRREATDGPEAITQADVVRVYAIECSATARMLSGEPPERDRPYTPPPREWL